jgi:pyruvate dehydrogenase E2 component (dihydrolipoamide acetyltransferase)
MRRKLSLMQKTMAKRMTQSAQEIPQFSISTDLDADALAERRAQQPEKVSITAVLISLIAKALREHPELNAQFDGDGVILHDDINVALAISIPGGLVTPVIRNADTLSVPEINVQIKDLAERSQNKKLTLDDFKDGTITVSNLGMMDVTHFTPLINPPQAAIIGICSPRTEARVDDDGSLTAGKVMAVAVSADHRVLDGATVATFLKTMKENLTQGEI